MKVLGSTYFWKFLKSCDPACLDEFGEVLRTTLSVVTGKEYCLVQPDSEGREKIRRWSKGSFNEPGELRLRFPRVLYVYHPISGAGGEHWIADVFFTRVPHIRGLYGSSSHNHVLAPSMEQELGVQLVRSHIADAFTYKNNRSLIGTAAGLYVYHKVRRIAALKSSAESSRYTPPGSDLKELMDLLPALLPEEQSSPLITELLDSRSKLRSFLKSSDQRVLGTLGKDKLQELLKASGITARAWLNAGTRTWWQRN